MFVEKRGIGMRQLAERVFGSAGTKANFSQTTKLQIIKLQKINRGSQFMRKIFISYRRDDSDEAASRLSDQLVLQFGQERIFMDVDGIAPGRDFRKVIDETLAQCDVLLGVLGRSWLDVRDDAGKRRLDNESDFVRLEIATALRRDIPVIPVRVQGAAVPKPEQLPDDLKEFSYRNAVELTHERWNSDVKVLVDKLRVMFNEPAPPSPSPPPQPAPPPVQPTDGTKWPTKKKVKWGLVAWLFLAFGYYLQTGESDSALGAVVMLAFLIWDPFKWFVPKA